MKTPGKIESRILRAALGGGPGTIVGGADVPGMGKMDPRMRNVGGELYWRELVALANSLEPDLILIPGDLFDGAKTTPEVLVAPFRDLKPRFGTYFSAGNHDEFGDVPHFFSALADAGVRVLIVDRNATTRTVLAEIAGRWGMWAESSASAPAPSRTLAKWAREEKKGESLTATGIWTVPLTACTRST